MRVFRVLISVAILCLFVSPVAVAQNGAEIIRGEDNFGMFLWDEDDTLMVIATEMYFFCGDEPEFDPYDYMYVIRPDGSVKVHEQGNLFTRVFQPATPDDFWGPDGNPCPFIEGGPLVAEGISHFTYNDNDANLGHPNRKNVWGFTVSGTLYDVIGACDSGMVDLNVIRRSYWLKNCETGPEDCIVPRVIKGPRLECVE